MYLIYFGPQYAAERTFGAFLPFTCLSSGNGVDWPAIQAALADGKELHIRPPTLEESAALEMTMAIYKASGGIVDDSIATVVYH